MPLLLLEPIPFLARFVSADFNVIVQAWKRLDYALPVNAIPVPVLVNVNGTILLRANDAKVDLNVSAIFLYWMDIVQNASCWNVLVILHFALPVILFMSAIVIKLTNNDTL